MVIKSFSKINLTLKVISKNRNGLHNIQSLYCWIDLFDSIKISKTMGKDKIIFKGPFAKLIKSKNNSVFNLLKILRKQNLISSNYNIIISKNIPVFSGLGGGTSNAAFILKYLLKDKITEKLLNIFKNKIGSDLKLFFKKTGFLKDLNTIVELKRINKFYFLLIKPKIRCSTKKIYSEVKKFSKREKFNKNIVKTRDQILDYITTNRNDLQFVVEKKHPFIKKLLKDIENEKGCCFSRMTGSGSVCYGLFKEQKVAKKALIKLKNKYPKFWFSLAKTV